jgi:hypothetical protein
MAKQKFRYTRRREAIHAVGRANKNGLRRRRANGYPPFFGTSCAAIRFADSPGPGP